MEVIAMIMYDAANVTTIIAVANLY